MNEHVLRQYSKSIAESAHRNTVMRLLADGIVPANHEVMDQLLATDYVAHSPLGDLDRDGLKAFLGALHRTLADFNMVQAHVVLSGDFAATRTVISGTFVRAFPGPGGPIRPTGKPVEWQMLNILRFNLAAQVAEEWLQFDYLSLLRELGVIVSIPSFRAMPQH